MNTSSKIDNKGKDILILGKGPTQGLGEHSLSDEKMYSINFTRDNIKFCLSFYYNGAKDLMVIFIILALIIILLMLIILKTYTNI